MLALLVAYPTLAPQELMLKLPLILPAVDEHTIMEKKKKKARWSVTIRILYHFIPSKGVGLQVTP